MRDIAKQPPEIGSRLLRLRKLRGLSLEDLAARSKISRSMLSQVERGLANPTFATLWALTQALGIDIAELIGPLDEPAHPNIQVIEAHNIPRITSGDGHCRLMILSPPETTGQMEWYGLEIDPGAALISEAHATGCREHLTLYEGDVEVVAADDRMQASAGMTLRYRADVDHSIRNLGATKLKALLVVLSAP